MSSLVSARRFVLLTYAGSGAIWGVAVLAGADVARGEGLAMLALGGVVPAAVALVLARRDGTLRRDLQRAIDPRPLAGLGGLAVVAWPVGAWAVTFLIVRAVAGEWPTIAGVPGSPGAFAGMAAAVLVSGPLPEELGWRGYLLPRIAAIMPRRLAALAVGVVWVVWHLPLFALPGMPLAAAYPIGSGAFFAWCAGMLALSVLFGELSRLTAASTLAAIALHFTFNFAAGLVAAPRLVMVAHFGVIVALALAVAAGARARSAR